MKDNLKNEKKALQKDLQFYLEFYKELASRSDQMKRPRQSSLTNREMIIGVPSSIKKQIL